MCVWGGWVGGWLGGADLQRQLPGGEGAYVVFGARMCVKARVDDGGLEGGSSQGCIVILC